MPAAARFLALGQSALVLWALFALVHAWLGILNLMGPGQPFGDVLVVYPFWVERGLNEGQWVGIDTSWVYPLLALVPMLAAYAAGPEWYGVAWLVMVSSLNAAAYLALLGARPRVPGARAAIAAGWMLFLLLLGPVALGRIDAVTVALAVTAVVLVRDHPRWAGALLAAGAWVKVWPAAVLVAALIAVRRRLAVLIGALAVSLAVVAVGLALGAGGALFSAVVEQSARGLQVESPAATPWLWAAVAAPGVARVEYDPALLTFQVVGPGTDLVAALTTPALALVVIVVAVLGVVAARRGIDEALLLPVLALALVMSLVLVNKVGSPQLASWVVVPVILGLLLQGRGGDSFLVPAILALAIAGSTQLVYPVLYDRLLALDPALVLVLTVRNLLYAALWGWALVRLAGTLRLARRSNPYDARMTVEGASS
ncbi:MAG: glycosyltransferase 87 family protein [Microcella sp.]|uniref:glycosyltransferase 87 family protein n=1 Tax=Microcella sp. TaxID=1913979 RepID=UPI003315D2D6